MIKCPRCTNHVNVVRTNLYDGGIDFECTNCGYIYIAVKSNEKE